MHLDYIYLLKLICISIFSMLDAHNTVCEQIEQNTWGYPPPQRNISWWICRGSYGLNLSALGALV